MTWMAAVPRCRYDYLSFNTDCNFQRTASYNEPPPFCRLHLRRSHNFSVVSVQGYIA